MINTLSPKERFLTGPRAASHQEWCRSDVGKSACEAALSEMTLSLNEAEITKLSGVKRFISILLNLSEPEIVRKPIESTTLRYDQPQPNKPNAT